MNTPSTIYHIATPTEWQTIQEQNVLAPDTLESEGFVHCSTSEQLLDTANRWYAEYEQLIVLSIDTQPITDTLAWEGPSPPSPHTIGQLFPHVYGPIPFDAITAHHTITRDADGYFHKHP